MVIKLGLCNVPNFFTASKYFPEPTVILDSYEDWITQLVDQSMFLENQPPQEKPSSHPPEKVHFANLPRILQSENLERNYLYCNVNKSVESFWKI